MKIENSKFELSVDNHGHCILIRWGVVPLGDGMKIIAFRLTVEDAVASMSGNKNFVEQSEEIIKKERETGGDPSRPYEWMEGSGFHLVNPREVTWYKF